MNIRIDASVRVFVSLLFVCQNVRVSKRARPPVSADFDAHRQSTRRSLIS